MEVEKEIEQTKDIKNEVNNNLGNSFSTELRRSNY